MRDIQWFRNLISEKTWASTLMCDITEGAPMVGEVTAK